MPPSWLFVVRAESPVDSEPVTPREVLRESLKIGEHHQRVDAIDHARNGPLEDLIDIGVDETLKNRRVERLEQLAVIRAAAAERVKARSQQ